MKKKIVKIMFSPDHVMMFGDSYKTWEQQLEEYLLVLKNHDSYPKEIQSVQVSDEPWIKWGGLKWCPEYKFQRHLNREGCQDSELDNPNPRKYADMRFYLDDTFTAKAKKLLSNVAAGIY